MTEDVFIPLFLISIPVLAIGGGVAAGITRTLSRHRLAELAYRERIVAIERGIDPTRLPAPPTIGERTADDDARTLVRVLVIFGMVAVFGSAALAAAIAAFESEKEKMIIATIPMLIGFALLASAWIIRPRTSHTERHESS